MHACGRRSNSRRRRRRDAAPQPQPPLSICPSLGPSQTPPLCVNPSLARSRALPPTESALARYSMCMENSATQLAPLAARVRVVVRVQSESEKPRHDQDTTRHDTTRRHDHDTTRHTCTTGILTPRTHGRKKKTVLLPRPCSLSPYHTVPHPRPHHIANRPLIPSPNPHPRSIRARRARTCTVV